MYQLIIAEKPSVAQSIAAVLGAKRRDNGYLEGNGYLVSWCFGHLAELASAETYNADYAKWRCEDLPIVPLSWRFKVSRDKWTQFDILKALMRREDVSAVINACDAGREGELIFRTAYHLAGCTKPMKRLWISSMEDAAIRAGFENLRPSSDYDGLHSAALCRAKADWLVGINATRLFSVLYHRTLNVGRVMSPTLALLVEREAEIGAFQSEPFYTVQLSIGDTAATSERCQEKQEAEKITAACKGQTATVKSVERKEKSEKAPALYDLTTLQRDANRILGYTAQQTLDYLQALYEKKLCTYPRTDARYLTDDMEASVPACAVVAAVICEVAAPEQVNAKQVVNSAKVSDHHAVIPTASAGKVSLADLPMGEREILRLVARQLLCAVSDAHRYAETTAVLSCGGNDFTLKGKTVLSPGWKAYPYNEQVMIYAQRPNATACAEYDFWYKRMGRYVRYGSTGIALVDVSADKPCLKYVFDISDTGGREFPRRRFLWELQQEHLDSVTAMLERNYDVSGADGLALQLERVAAQLADEYWNDHQRDILGIVDDSFLEEYDDFNIGVAFRNAAVVSITYSLMSRCGLEPDEYFEHEDFLSIFDFNTPPLVAALGTAVSEINEQVLRHIEVTVKNYERERSADHDRKAVRHLSDTICVEHGLSIVENPKRHGKSYNKWRGERAEPPHRELLRYAIDDALSKKPADFEALLKLLTEDGCEIRRRGKNLSVKLKEKERFVRLNNLGDGYCEEDLLAVILGQKEHKPRKKAAVSAPPKVNLLIDIDAKLRDGKGMGYKRWASVFNAKQLAQTMTYLQEHKLMDYRDLKEKTEAATVRYNELSAQIKAAEARMGEIVVLKQQIINYAKTREVFAAYKASGYSKKYLAEHEADILLHRTAKKAFNELGLKKLPTVKSLQEEYAKLLSEKKAAYADYRKARDEMRELLTIQSNVDRILGNEQREVEKEKEQEQR